MQPPLYYILGVIVVFLSMVLSAVVYIKIQKNSDLRLMVWLKQISTMDMTAVKKKGNIIKWWASLAMFVVSCVGIFADSRARSWFYNQLLYSVGYLFIWISCFDYFTRVAGKRRKYIYWFILHGLASLLFGVSVYFDFQGEKSDKDYRAEKFPNDEFNAESLQNFTFWTDAIFAFFFALYTMMFGLWNIISPPANITPEEQRELQAHQSTPIGVVKLLILILLICSCVARIVSLVDEALWSFTETSESDADWILWGVASLLQSMAFSFVLYSKSFEIFCRGLAPCSMDAPINMPRMDSETHGTYGSIV